jgi:hypothetical protein
MKGIRRHLSYANVAATLALVLAMSGGAIAATGGFGGGGKLTACVNSEGALRLLKAGRHCRRGQKPVTWNQQGPAGARGAAGAPGVPGAPGPTGPAGKNGTSATESIVIHSKSHTFGGGGGGGFSEKIMCDEGERAISGGVSRADGTSGAEAIVQSAPVTRERVVVEEGDVPAGWVIGYETHEPGQIIAEVTCVR